MRRRKKIPKIKRKLFAEARAKDFICRNQHLTSLPVDPFELYEINGWYLFSWDEARIILGEDDPLRLKETGAEARTSRPRGSNDYITVYDNSIIPSTRIRWTISHEIGHIVLGHLTDFDNTAMNRGGIQPDEYEVLEKEADLFAAELLAPFAVLSELNIKRFYDIRTICNVSNPAALNRERYILWRKRGLDYYDRNIIDHFNNFIRDVTRCSGRRRLEVKERMENQTPNIIPSINPIPVETDAIGRFKTCPRCRNDEFSKNASYCKICGLFLFNSCSNALYSMPSYNCGRKNPGDARHCESCGELTYLFISGLLSSWQDWMIEKEKEKEVLQHNHVALKSVAFRSSR